jgi:HEAT repeat protein
MSRRTADALARDHTERAIDTLAQIMSDEFAEDRDRIRAAESILDRGHGKPLQASISVPTSKAQAARLAAMSDEELLMLIQEAPLPRLSGPKPDVVEADFSEVAPADDPLLA